MTPPRALTLVVPVDAGDLDLLGGDVLLHELLALQPVPQRGLARVPVASDHYLHWREGEGRSGNQTSTSPRLCAHAFLGADPA